MNKNNIESTESIELKTSIGKKEIYFLLFIGVIILGLFVCVYNLKYKHEDESYRVIGFEQKDGKNYYSYFDLHKYKENNGVVYADTRMLKIGYCMDLYNFSVVSCRDKKADGIVSNVDKNGEIILFKEYVSMEFECKWTESSISVVNNNE